MRILITGADGQLGKSFESIKTEHKDHDFLFVSKSELDVSDRDAVFRVLPQYDSDIIVNCAAMTNVDSCEIDTLAARINNYDAVYFLASYCMDYQVKLVEISTDFVFDGKSSRPYMECDEVHPINIYGLSKKYAEDALRCTPDTFDYMIVRTSWLYSEFGDNFATRLLRQANASRIINMTGDTLSSPTYAPDLARCVLQLIELDMWRDTFHFCNEGEVSKHEFAEYFLNRLGYDIEVRMIQEWGSVATRPKYSVLDCSKVKAFGIKVPSWKRSLKNLIRLNK